MFDPEFLSHNDLGFPRYDETRYENNLSEQMVEETTQTHYMSSTLRL